MTLTWRSKVVAKFCDVLMDETLTVVGLLVGELTTLGVGELANLGVGELANLGVGELANLGVGELATLGEAVWLASTMTGHAVAWSKGLTVVVGGRLGAHGPDCSL